jgi:large subunit ribosomal protein L24
VADRLRRTPGDAGRGMGREERSVSAHRIKKNDTVIAISGANVGRSGKVLQVMPAGNRVLVEGLNLVKKALRKTQDNPQGGIAEKEAPIDISNLMLYCPHDKKGVKVRIEADGDRKIRKCKRCGHAFDG